MKKILILGGTYFIEKKLVEKLKKYNYGIYLLNRGTKKEIMQGVKYITADRNDPISMKNALSGYKFEYIVDISGLNEYHVSILSNYLNTEKLKKMIFISSSSVYDIDNVKIPISESSNLSPNKYWGEYGKDKILAESKYCEWSRIHNIPLVILRPPYVYGENNYARRESFVFNHIENDELIIIPKSNNYIQFILVDDLADIIITTLKDNITGEKIFNVGNSNIMTFLDWVNFCAKVMNKTANTIFYEGKYRDKDYFPFHAYDNVLDVSEMKK